MTRSFLTACLVATSVLACARTEENAEGELADTAALAPASPAPAQFDSASAMADPSPVAADDEAGFYYLCTDRSHPGGSCWRYPTKAEAESALAAHRKQTGHTGGGVSAGKCPVAPEN
jgi:hypothetical protein